MDDRTGQDAGIALLTMAPAPLRRAVESRMRSLRAQKGRTIIGVGARAGDVFFVTQGQVQVLLYSRDGREVSVRNLDAGELFGDLAALDGLPRSASVIALSEVRLRVMSRDDFIALVEGSPEAGGWMARRLTAEVRRLTERVFELSALNVRSRLHCELLRLAREGGSTVRSMKPAPTHAELANRIGSHREAVTREMRALADMNIIRNTRRSLEFLDLPELERMVCRAVGEVGEGAGAR
jgi:CRP-like cAMP-binding protein